LKEEALDRILWRTRFGRDCGPVVRRITPVMRQYTLNKTLFASQVVSTESIKKLLFVPQWRNFDRKHTGNVAALSPPSIHDTVIHPLLCMITNSGICGLLAAD